jgi:hypothetical protein
MGVLRTFWIGGLRSDPPSGLGDLELVKSPGDNPLDDLDRIRRIAVTPYHE